VPNSKGSVAIRKIARALLPWVVVAALSGIGAWLTRLDFWPLFAITAVAVFVNGLIATFEDDLPGGFNNPDGTSTPRYVALVRRAARVIGVLFVVLVLSALALWASG
jgi:hypothetical protein